ncbi:MAG: hypothetical protein Q8Q24_00850 [bacterium]|nr:hypothetical protein [bacterium]
MKKYLLSIFSFSIFSFFSFLVVFPVQAQNFDFSKALQDYSYNYNLYRSNYIEYVAATGEYQRYQTLTSQTKALDLTKVMLKSRDEALRTYLTALRLRLAETPKVTSYQQNLSFTKLDAEIAWLSSHKDSLNSPGTLPDLIKVSDQLQQKYPGIELLSYQVLGTILTGRENDLRDQVKGSTTDVEKMIEEKRNQGVNVDKLDRWLLEARNKISLSEAKQADAERTIQNIKVTAKNKSKVFNQAQFTYEESNQYLKESVTFLTEILNELKND